MRLAVIVLALGVLASPVASQQWYTMHVDEERLYMADLGSVATTSEGTALIWGLAQHTPAARDGVLIDYQENHDLIDCTGRKMKPVKVVNRASDGRALLESPALFSFWRDVQTDTVQARLLDMACTGVPPADWPFRTPADVIRQWRQNGPESLSW